MVRLHRFDKRCERNVVPAGLESFLPLRQTRYAVARIPGRLSQYAWSLADGSGSPPPGLAVKNTHVVVMPGDGAITFRDIVGKLEVLRITCDKCGRRGQYRVDRLMARYGLDGKINAFSNEVTADCPRKRAVEFPSPTVRAAPPHARSCTVDDVEFYYLKLIEPPLQRDLSTVDAMALQLLRTTVGWARSLGNVWRWANRRNAGGCGQGIEAADDIAAAPLPRQGREALCLVKATILI